LVQKRRVSCDPLTLTFQGDLASTKRALPERKLAQMRWVYIMSRELVTVEFGTPLEQAWALLRERRIKALPVVDRTFHIAGIITLADFMRAAEFDGYEGFGKLRIRWERPVDAWRRPTHAQKNREI